MRRSIIDIRRALIYTHRWLGIAGCLVFISWFASGIVMMYAGMPELPAAERIARQTRIDLSTARVSPAQAAEAAGGSVDRVRVTMFGGRPVYRLLQHGTWTTVFADTGDVLEAVTPEQALDVARRFAPEHAGTIAYGARLETPDQWTLSGEPRRAMPLHRVALGDAAESFLYISESTGEPVMKTDAASRRRAYAGAVMHWIYFTPLRRHSELWAQAIIWSSIAGCLMCLSGLTWGVWRFSASARYRLKRQHAHSPYAGLMKWHHYAGLIFGVAAFTWVFSGLLSMNPWEWAPETSATRQQRDAVAGGSLRLDLVSLDALRTALAQHSTDVGEIEILQFRGQPFVASSSSPVRFDRDALVAASRAAMPAAGISDASWLTDYDAYYYDRTRAAALPVLRVRFDDPHRTWLYLDPRRGTIVRKEERLSRLNRWLYHGLHSLDFPFLYYRRPLWDVIVIVLSAGGLVLSATTLTAAVHRLRRHVRRFRREGETYAIRTDPRADDFAVRTRRARLRGDL